MKIYIKQQVDDKYILIMETEEYGYVYTTITYLSRKTNLHKEDIEKYAESLNGELIGRHSKMVIFKNLYDIENFLNWINSNLIISKLSGE